METRRKNEETYNFLFLSALFNRCHAGFLKELCAVSIKVHSITCEVRKETTYKWPWSLCASEHFTALILDATQHGKPWTLPLNHSRWGIGYGSWGKYLLIIFGQGWWVWPCGQGSLPDPWPHSTDVPKHRWRSLVIPPPSLPTTRKEQGALPSSHTSLGTGLILIPSWVLLQEHQSLTASFLCRPFLL